VDDSLRRLRTISRAHSRFLTLVLGQLAFIVIAPVALRAVGVGQHSIDGLCGFPACVLEGRIWLAIYQLSSALQEKRPSLRLATVFLPWASLSVLIALHGKAVHRMRILRALAPRRQRAIDR